MKYAFIFVCQSGLLEIQSILLAASLKRFVELDHTLIAAVPLQFGDLHPITYKILDSIGVQVTHIINDFDPLYAVGNKLFAANVLFDCDKKVFLDSDLICMKPFSGQGLVGNGTFISTSRFDIISHREWRNVHAMFNLNIKPYFQHVRSPFVCFSNHIGFAEKWLTNCREVLSDKITIRRKRQADQISLAITVQQYDDMHVLDWQGNQLLQSPSEVFNFDRYGKLIESQMPYFLVLQKGWLYYSRQGHPVLVASNPNSLAYYDSVRSLIYSLISEHPLMDRHPSWIDLHKLYFAHEPMKTGDLGVILRGVEGVFK